jgi:CrcB protein
VVNTLASRYGNVGKTAAFVLQNTRAMEFAINRLPGLITPTNLCRENSIVLDLLIISLGAIVGANARYLISRFAARLMGPVFPYGTLVINVSGSIIVGFFMIWASERVLLDPRWRLLVVVGFCGAFTTFSSYAYETMVYFEQGQWALMFTNFAANNLLCLAGALAGMALARMR